MISIQNITLRRGTKVLFSSADITIHDGESIGVTGTNGCGKSSLFALLTGELGADSGDLQIPRNWRITLMSQEVEATKRSALDYVIDGDKTLRGLQQELAEAEASEDNHAIAHLHAALESHDGYTAVSRAQQLLAGLGFADADQHRPVTDFSGGWRIRLNLAQTLMCPSDLMLLDEPTNHLDLDTVGWLEQWLRRYSGTLLIISHDRDFLDAVTQRTLQFESGKLHIYKGNYSAAERQRAERLSQQQAMYEKQQTRIAEIDAFVRRFRAKATKAKQAQSRLKELDRLERIEAAHVDSPFSFKIPCHDRMSDPLLNIARCDLGYGDNVIVRQANLGIRPGDRFGILGANGAGKSTLLKTVAGLQPAISGDRVCGEHLRIGYFSQHQLEALDLDATALLHLQRLNEKAREQEIRNFLGGFGFPGETADADIKPFSGGEKARLALAIIAWQKPNLLILDEPTNHLDLEMRHALTVALQTYEGAVLVVSHDRHLLKNTVDQLLWVHNGKLDDFDGTLEDYQNRMTQTLKSNGASGSRPDEKKARRQQAAELRKSLQPLKNALKKLEKAMQKNAEKLQDLEAALADPSLYEAGNHVLLQTLLKEQGLHSKQQESLEEDWLEQQEQLETAESDL
ncbi:MAG: ATP-binding cassette domain-containing protein [Pseudomonadales bacterium]